MGRDHELAIFGTILADASCRGVLVCGPGVGKTGLAEEFLLIATTAGRASGRATGGGLATEVPLGALAHLLPAGHPP